MISKNLKYQCDCCGDMAFMPEDSKESPQGWRITTEVGDLCPKCSKAWDIHKQDFIEKMRK